MALRLDFSPTGNATADDYLYRLRAKLLTLALPEAIALCRQHLVNTEKAAPPGNDAFAYSSIISFLYTWLAELRQARTQARAA